MARLVVISQVIWLCPQLAPAVFLHCLLHVPFALWEWTPPVQGQWLWVVFPLLEGPVAVRSLVNLST